jgi:hypothetical protein
MKIAKWRIASNEAQNNGRETASSPRPSPPSSFVKSTTEDEKEEREILRLRRFFYKNTAPLELFIGEANHLKMGVSQAVLCAERVTR